MFRTMKFVSLVLIVLCLIIVFANVQRAKANPSNDLFANAAQIVIPLQQNASFYGLISEPDPNLEIGEPTPTCVKDSGVTLAGTTWYKVTASQPTDLILGIGAPLMFQYALGIYQGDSLETLQQIACGFYSGGGSNRIRRPMNEGETWYIQFGMVNYSPSNIDLAFVFYAPPANDAFGQAEVIPNTGAFSGDSTNATIEPNEIFPSCLPAGYQTGDTVWYVFKPQNTKTYFFELSDYASWEASPFMALYDATKQEKACVLNNDRLSQELQAGEPYYIQVGERMLEHGFTFILHINEAPANDTMAGAETIAGTMVDLYANNQYATMDTTEPVPGCVSANHPGKTLWYSFTPQEEANYDFIFYPEFTMFAAVYENNGINEIACMRENTHKIIHLAAGVQYYLQIGGIDSASGNIHFYIRQLPPPPSNDNFTDAQQIALASLPTGYSFENAGATHEANDPVPSCLSDTPDNIYTMWYFVTSTEPVTLYTDLSVYDYTYPAVAIYKQQDGALIEIACNRFDWWSQQRMTTMLEGNQQYYLMFANTVTPVSYRINFNTPPVNDSMAHPQEVALMPERTTLIIDNTLASVEADEPYQSCLGSLPSNTLWYAFTPGKTISIWFDYNNFSTWPTPVIAVYEKTESGINAVACQDPSQSRLKMLVEEGKTYLIQFGSIYGTGTNFELNINFPPPNDDFANAIEISGATSEMAVNIQYSGLEEGEPDPGMISHCDWWGCSPTPVGQTVWYKFTTPESVTTSYQIIAESANVYTGNWGSLSKVISWDSGSSHVFGAEPGKTYYIQLGASADNTNPLRFSINLTPGFTLYGVYFDPYSPTIYDDVYFSVYYYDPMNIPIKNYTWDFGDNTSPVTTDQSSVPHHYTADANSYNATVTITTQDGRSASSTVSVPVITRNVTVTKFTLPDNVRAGQTRTVYVYVANPSKYNETVKVEIYRSTPAGDVKFGELIQDVVITPMNQPVRFAFSYTFTQADAAVGKVTFKAVAKIVNYANGYGYYEERDALPGDNTAISTPVRVR